MGDGGASSWPTPAATRCSPRRWPATTAARSRHLVSELGGAGRPRRAPARRTGLGHRPHRRQLAGRLGRLRTGAPRAGAQRHRHRARRRMDALDPGQIRGDRASSSSGMPLLALARCSGPRRCSCRSAAGWRPCRSAGSPDGVSDEPADRHRRRRGALPRLLPAAGQIAAAARPAGVGANRRARPAGAVREGPGLPRPRFHRYFTGPAAHGNESHRARRTSATSRCSRRPAGSPRSITDFLDEHSAADPTGGNRPPSQQHA